MRPPGTLSHALNSATLALFLALIVWVVATNNDLKRVTFPSTLPERGIPIELVNLPEGLIVTEGENQRVLADILVPVEWENELEPSDLVARVDLRGYEVGTHQVEVRVERQPFAPPFRLTGWKPDRIVIELDAYITRTLPIEVQVENVETVPPNYRVLTPTLSMPTMTIAGPAAVVEKIEQVVAEISVSNARASVTGQVRPRLLTATGEADRSVLRLTPEQVEVTVPIEQRQGFRELIVRALIQGTPAPGYWVSSVNVDPKLVTVKGQPNVVNELDGIVDTVPVNVEGLEEGEFSRNVPLQLDEDISPLSDGFVQVRIKIEPQTSSKTVTVAPTVVGLQPGLAITPTGIVPPTVDVLLKGPIIELEDLNLDAVIVTLDLSGLPAGTHLVVPRITPPSGLRAESIIPEQVEVTIAEQLGSRELLVPLTLLGQSPQLTALVEPPSITLAIEGPLLTLESLEPAMIPATLDVSGRPAGRYQLTPTLTTSLPISISSLTPFPVRVTLFQESSLLVINAPIQLLNVPQGNQVTLSSEIAIVRVAGAGTGAALSRHPTFRVSLDLAGRAAGRYSLRPDVRLPPGYTLVGIVPDEVVVNVLPVSR